MSTSRARLTAIAALILLAAGTADAQWLKYTRPGVPRTADGAPNLKAPAPRMPDGTPDLSGVWRVDAGGYGLNLLTDVPPADIMPWADALFRERSEAFSTEYPGLRCLPDIGPIYSFDMFKLLQTRGTTAILSEQGRFRQIHTDGRPLPENPNPTWMGYSIGRWEKGTFVVTTAGFNDLSWLDFGGHPHTEALRVTERYRRIDYGHMRIEMTFEDPRAYARPFSVAVDAELAPDTELLEYVCNENEKDVQHFLITEEDRRKARAASSLTLDDLTPYVGRYELTDLTGQKVPFSVTVSGNRLLLQPPTGGKYAAVAESATVFSIAGARVEFFRDAGGAVSHFVVSTVEGDQKAVRVK